MLLNEYLLANLGFDTTKNTPSNVWQRLATFGKHLSANMHFSLRTYIFGCENTLFAPFFFNGQQMTQRARPPSSRIEWKGLKHSSNEALRKCSEKPSSLGKARSLGQNLGSRVVWVVTLYQQTTQFCQNAKCGLFSTVPAPMFASIDSC